MDNTIYRWCYQGYGDVRKQLITKIMNNKKTYEKPWIIVEAFSTERGLCLSYGEAGKAEADGSYIESQEEL